MNTNHTDDFAELHAEVAAVAREVLACSAPRWATIAQAGWPGLEVSAAFDGADAGFAEVAVVLTEIGRAAASGPYPALAALAVGALNSVVPTPDRDRLLRETALGAAVPIVALAGEGMEAPHLSDCDSRCLAHAWRHPIHQRDGPFPAWSPRYR
ncbi:acyl-CoA dehydrogenase family protein, partial [Nocardia salmonicida]|uniref:acyl-CoA dehydrogenase family protein n=1 Tax=Nocardia salmonicida TaxID=53431 RepID=UPI003657EFA1